jgi:hypothetical protein
LVFRIISASIVEEDALEVRLELAVEVGIEGVETVVGLDVGSAAEDADVESIEVPCQVLVDSLLQLGDVLGVAQVVDGGEANVLQFDESLLH